MKMIERNQGVINLYKTGKYTTERIACIYGISSRQVQRIAKDAGIIRTQAESNKAMAPLKKYHTIPPELRVKRKYLSLKQRFQIIRDHPYCTVCGKRPNDGIHLEIDHIDENPSNNSPDNLQVLCGLCNRGKSHDARF